MVWTLIVCAVKVPRTIKLSADDAVFAFDAVNAWAAYDAVPNNEPVIPPLILKLPVDIIEPEVYKEPVNTKVSAFDVNNVLPVVPIIFVDPLTVNEPEITVDPVIVVLVFTTKPPFGEIEAVTEPENIWDKFNPTTLLEEMLINPEPSPLNEPVNDPVLYELLKDKKLADKDDILALFVVALEANDELSLT